MFSYRGALDAAVPEDLVCHALPWVVEAGNPYYDTLLDGIGATRAMLEIWMRRASSEVSIQRVQLLMEDAGFAGGFIALNGADLRKARQADSVALLRSVPAEARPTLMKRLANMAGLFSPVDDNEFYLSKFGLTPQFRGKGLSRMLLAQYLEEGARLGYVRYRLDVYADNEAAIRCYRSAGFEIDQRTQSQDGKLRYFSMSHVRLIASKDPAD